MFAQIDSIQTEEILNEILDDQSEESESEEISDAIEYLLNNPIDVNSADLSTLQKIPLIDFTSANIILDHRKKYGSFFSTNELYSISSIPKETMRKIIPFLKIGSSKIEQKSVLENIYPDKSFLEKTKINLRSRTLNDMQERKGFKTNKFDGSSYKIYNRVIFKYDYNFQAGVTLEKDAGETALTDYNSFHFQMKDYGIINSIVLGDYILEFGQGLAMWGAYGFSKSADAVFSVKRKPTNLKPYTSTDENNFFRGAAAQISFSNFGLTAFYSNNNFDANIDSVSGIILSRPLDGMHRNENELGKKNSAEEKLTGASLNYSLSNILKAGILYYRSSFSNPFSSDDVFGLNGDSFNYYSIFYEAYYNNINIFGEFAYDGKSEEGRTGSVASINGLQISFSKDFIFATSVRNYPRNYKNLHGFGFGEQSGKTENEFGIYSGFKWRTSIGIINFYYDQFKFPYSTFDNPLPGSGDEFLFDLSSKPLPLFETKLRLKYERKDISITNPDSKYITKRERHNSRIELLYNLSRFLRLKGRFDYNSYIIKESNTFEEGYLFYQEIKYAPNSDLNFYGRIIFFQTDSFNSAVYEYENDLVGVLSNFAMFGEGMRWYIAGRYKPVKNISLSFKYSETYKPGEKSLSSGDSEIEGGLDNRLSFQLDFIF